MPHSTTERIPIEKTLVVCLGNDCRGDDGFGPLVAQRLGKRVGANVEVIAHEGDALSLLDLWQDCGRVILVDAIAIDRAPGTVLHFDLSGAPIPLELGGASTHALGPGGAIEIARILGQLPRRLEIVAVAGSDFGAGTRISAAVAAQVDAVAREIRHMIQDRKPAARETRSPRNTTEE